MAAPPMHIGCPLFRAREKRADDSAYLTGPGISDTLGQRCIARRTAELDPNLVAAQPRDCSGRIVASKFRLAAGAQAGGLDRFQQRAGLFSDAASVVAACVTENRHAPRRHGAQSHPGVVRDW